jgi:hypothetical protein
VEAEVVSTSPSAYGRSRGGKEVQKGHEQPKGRMRKGANPDSEWDNNSAYFDLA